MHWEATKPNEQPAIGVGDDRRISVRDATAVENPLNAASQQQLSSTRAAVPSKQAAARSSASARLSVRRELPRGRRASSVTKALNRLQSSPRSFWNELIVAVLALAGAFIGLHAIGKLSLKALLISQVAFVGMLLFLAGRTSWFQALLEWSPLLKAACRLGQTILAFAPAGDIATDALATVTLFVGAADGRFPIWWFIFSATVMALSFRGAAVLKFYTAWMVPEEKGKFFFWFIPLMFVPGGPYYCRALSLFSAEEARFESDNEKYMRDLHDVDDDDWEYMSAEDQEEWKQEHPPMLQEPQDPLVERCRELLNDFMDNRFRTNDFAGQRDVKRFVFACADNGDDNVCADFAAHTADRVFKCFAND